ncbi:MAG: hypothetical protein HWN80_12395 [Candidatus Lokiarchaeota archaeon]|nr:hypothetical protein [Candidatus Lokiarchaeota archaeon]
MKRQSINTKLTLVVIIGILTLSCIPFVVADAGNGRVTTRPIEDWLAPVIFHPLGGMPDYDDGLIIWTFLDKPSIPHFASALDYNPKGCVIERELKNNILLVTVKMRAKDVPFHITSYMVPIPSAIPIFKGVMDFTYKLKFTIDLDTLGPDDYNEEGNIIYHTWDYYVWELFTLESVFLCGHGSGEFLNPHDSWDEGDTAKMHVISHMVVVGEDYTGPNPYYNLQGLFEIVLVSTINFH